MWLVGIIVCLGWIFSLCLHEFSHAIVAYWGGDTSVKRKGYLTFNPLKYTDPGNSLVLPVLFLLMGGIGLPGGAVYIDRHKLRNRWWQSAVSAAGPVANILLALLLAILFWIFTEHNLDNVDRIDRELLVPSALAFVAYLQVFAAIFNLLPIPGLDGYGTIEPWLPKHIQDRLNGFRKYSTLAIVGLFWFVPGFNHLIFHFVEFVTSTLNIPGFLIAAGSSLFREPINKGIALVFLMILGWGLTSPEQKWSQTGKSLIEKKQYQEAIVFFDRVIKANPLREDAWLQKGYCLWQLDLFDRAISCYEKAIEIDRDNEYAHLAIGLNLFSIEKYREAIFYLSRLVELNSQNIDAYYYLGLAHQRSQEFDLAAVAFDRALNLSPKQINILHAKGALLHELKDYKAAIQTYQKLVETAPDNATGWYDLACCYALDQNTNLAIASLTKAIELEPDPLKNLAGSDPDFGWLCENQMFKDLIN
jgi:tetratricopeptide (TPR) repeat protein